MVRKFIESLYTGRCDIYEFVPQKKDNGTTTIVERLVAKGQPCRLSYATRLVFSGLKNSGESDLLVNKPIQQVKLIIRPDLNIKAGSMIVVTQNGTTQSYKNSGESAIYRYHQEIMLEKLKKWA